MKNLIKTSNVLAFDTHVMSALTIETALVPRLDGKVDISLKKLINSGRRVSLGFLRQGRLPALPLKDYLANRPHRGMSGVALNVHWHKEHHTTAF